MKKKYSENIFIYLYKNDMPMFNFLFFLKDDQFNNTYLALMSSGDLKKSVIGSPKIYPTLHLAKFDTKLFWWGSPA